MDHRNRRVLLGCMCINTIKWQLVFFASNVLVIVLLLDNTVVMSIDFLNSNVITMFNVYMYIHTVLFKKAQ